MKKIMPFLSVLGLSVMYTQIVELLRFKRESFINSIKKSNFCSSLFFLDCHNNKVPVKVSSLCIPISSKGCGLCFPTTLWQLVTIIGFNSLLAHSFLKFQSQWLEQWVLDMQWILHQDLYFQRYYMFVDDLVFLHGRSCCWRSEDILYLILDPSICISHINISLSLFPLLHGMFWHKKNRSFDLISSGGGLQTHLKWLEFLSSSEMRNYIEICMSLCSFICTCTSGSNSYLCFKVFSIWSRCVKKNIILADNSLLIAPGTNSFGCTLNFELLHALIYQTNTDCSDKINICSEIVRFWEANFHKYINSFI